MQNEITIKLTPTKSEQLKVIQEYERALYSINNAEGRTLEEEARFLLYDAIRAKYNYIISKQGRSNSNECL